MSTPIWFTVTTSQPDTSTVVLRLEGDLDLVGLDRFEAAWRAGVALVPGGSLVLELEALRFIDSTGLRGLVGLRAAAQSQGVRLLLRRPTDAVMRVLELVGLDAVLEIERDGDA